MKAFRLKLWQKTAVWLAALALTAWGIYASTADVVKYAGYYAYAPAQAEGEPKKFIRWAEFNVPYSALEYAMNYDIKSHKDGGSVSWIQLLALSATKYGGTWKRWNKKDIDAFYNKLCKNESVESTAKNKYYSYYHEVYTAVLSGFLGQYRIEADDPKDKTQTAVGERYGLQVFSPIASGYYYSEYDDFGSSRNYGYKRRHLGHDMMGNIGTPIIVVEGGEVTECGWNQYGGWRVGIRTKDTKRYYYYAHLRKDHPFGLGIAKGRKVQAGDVIGYMGMTGYSTKENVNNINKPHLHFGLQLIFDESQVKGSSEIWVDVYALTGLLKKNKMPTVRADGTNDRVRKFKFV